MSSLCVGIRLQSYSCHFIFNRLNFNCLVSACDCIPLEVSESIREYDVHRGNCQAHAFYDVCRVLPQIKLIRGENSRNDDLSTLPPVCPLVRDWFRSEDSQDWEVRDDHFVDPAVEYFLSRMIEATELLTDRKVWQECFRLESTQRRIEVSGPQWQTLETMGELVGRHEACFVWHEGRGFLLGGRGSKLVNEFDPNTNTWTSHPGTALDVHHTQCVSMNGKIWFPGAWRGRFPQEANWANMPVYDPALRTWDTTSYPTFAADRMRGSGAAVVYKGKIYQSHGNNGKMLRSLNE